MPDLSDIIDMGSAATALAECFGVDCKLPTPIAVWVVDTLNPDSIPHEEILVQLRSACGDNEHPDYSPDYADLQSGRSVPALSIFLRGCGYSMPEVLEFEDYLGKFYRHGQRRTS